MLVELYVILNIRTLREKNQFFILFFPVKTTIVKLNGKLKNISRYRSTPPSK